MSEEILRVELGELKTLRIRFKDGEVVELPLCGVGRYCDRIAQTDHHRITEEARKSIVSLAKAIEDVSAIESLEGVEFSIPVDPRVQ